jgi:hypothetical protein
MGNLPPPTVMNGYKLSQDDVTLNNVHIKMHNGSQSAIINSVQGGYNDGFTLKNCIVSGSMDAPGDVPGYNEKWGARLYNMRSTLFVDTIFRNIEEEHGAYVSRAGSLRILRCTFLNCGSQGYQDTQREIDSIEGRASNVPALLEVLDSTFDRCAMPQGSRQSWNCSIFGYDENLRQWYPDGPLILTPQGNPQKGHFVRSLTDVVIANCNFIGKGFPHLASGNRQCDSTGAILVGERYNASITNCTFDFVRPDREIIQLKDIETASVTNCAFTDGDIVLDSMDNCSIVISGCTGSGDIRRRAPGSTKTTFLAKIAAGYSH